jgi:heterotetrameric sarcosine oxidase delta subunit
MLLDCPWCGSREIEEFRFRSVLVDESPAAGTGADALASRPPGAAGAYARIYERRNTTDSSVEYWQHERGCRAWLVVHRDPSTAQVVDVRLLAPAPDSQP